MAEGIRSWRLTHTSLRTWPRLKWRDLMAKSPENIPLSVRETLEADGVPEDLIKWTLEWIALAHASPPHQATNISSEELGHATGEVARKE